MKENPAPNVINFYSVSDESGAFSNFVPYRIKLGGKTCAFATTCHGAGRAMSRTEAKRRFTLEDHIRATEGVECRKDAEVIDETPMAYKDIDAVMAAQADLVEVVHTLKQVVCVKG